MLAFLWAAVNGPLRLLGYLYAERGKLSLSSLLFMLMSGFMVYFTATTLVHQAFLVRNEWVVESEIQASNEQIVADCRLFADRPLRYAKGTKSDCDRAAYVARTWPIARALDSITAQWPTPSNLAAPFVGAASTLENKLMLVSTLGTFLMILWYAARPMRRFAKDRTLRWREQELRNYELMGLMRSLSPKDPSLGATSTPASRRD